MKFLSYGKDGGPESTVSGFWFVEIKPLFSIVLLKFEEGSRDAYHEHAFNSVSWLLKGVLREEHLRGTRINYHVPGWLPIITKRDTYHQVKSLGTSWVFSIRGPWAKTWKEYRPTGEVTLTNGRKEV